MFYVNAVFSPVIVEISLEQVLGTYRESSWLCVYCVKTVVSKEASRLLYMAGMSTL